MSDPVGVLGLELVIEDADAAELDESTTRLRRELLQLDIDSAERRYEGEPPEGARAVEIAALGALVVKLAPGVPVLSGVVKTVQSWLGNRPNRTVHLEMEGDSIELSGVSSAQQQQLIDSWVARHSAV